MNKNDMRVINEIIIHCTANKAGSGLKTEDIKRYHVNVRKFRTIGYHYVIEEDGSVHPGRAISQPGAHCLRHNAHSIGIAYIGGLDASGKPADTRTFAQKCAMRKLLYKLCCMYHCRVVGHNKYAPKACPCFDAETEYKTLAETARTL